MRFDARHRVVSGLAAALLAAGCGGSKPQDLSGDYKVGREPAYLGASYLWRGGDTNRLVIVNEGARTIESFTLDPFTHVASASIPHRNVKAGLVGAANGEYVVTFAEEDYAVVKRGGAVRIDPVAIDGEIQSVAYEPTLHLLVITSSLQSMTMITLDETGEVTGSFVASGLAAEGKALGAGALLSDGRLAVAAGETTMLVVDVRATVQQQAIVKSSFEVEGATAMGWINQIPGAASALLVLDGTRLLVVDAASGAISDQKSLADLEVKGRFRDRHPHIVTQNAGQAAQGVLEITFADADGKLATRTLRASAYPLEDTWLDVSTMSFTALFAPEGAGVLDGKSWSDDVVSDESFEIYRFSLADPANQVPLDKSEVDADLRVALAPGYLFVQHASALGKSERRTHGKEPESAFVTGYNLDLLRGRYRDE